MQEVVTVWESQREAPTARNPGSSVLLRKKQSAHFQVCPPKKGEQRLRRAGPTRTPGSIHRSPKTGEDPSGPQQVNKYTQNTVPT